MAAVCKKAVVTGRVQGVSYRHATQQRAQALGITGWANNLADGRVEVFMCGSAEAITELVQWLHEGPRLAQVTEVQVREATWQTVQGFTTG